jgi:DNA-binding transcriptional MerR regulator
MAPKLYKAAEVCEVAQLQPFVLKSWEKEFPRIGVQKSAESARLYRQSDLDQVLRIKDLVFREGLTLSGARRRIEESAPAPATATDDEVEEVLEALASDARTRIARVRHGLQSILRVLSSAPGTVVIVDDDVDDEPVRTPKRTAAPAKRAGGASRPLDAARGKPLDGARGKSKSRIVAKASHNGKPAKKRSRASA